MPRTYYPRPIRPELIEIGDEIEVTLPENAGAIHSYRGTVASREDHGIVRYLSTAQGHILLAWEPGNTTSVKVTLHGRTPIAGQSLFDVAENWDVFMDNIRERIE